MMQIGRGGMGTVYRALDETLDRPVALKMMNADLLTEESVQRFRSEAITLARLSHPHIAAIHELTRDDHELLMVMELVQGHPTSWCPS
jgi:serine/threonine protein kinase